MERVRKTDSKAGVAEERMPNVVRLSDRLQALADLVTPGNRFCDVGCDHGFLSIALVQSKTVPKAIAMDLRKGPLSMAKAHIAEAGLSDRIETRLSDGVAALLPGEADTILVAGMGGNVTLYILREGKEVFAAAKEVILQPQSEIARVREEVTKEGYRFLEERLILEDGKFYPMMKLLPPGALDSPDEPDGSGMPGIPDANGGFGEKPLTEAECLYGPLLLRERPAELLLLLQKELKEQERIRETLPEAAGERRREVEHRIALIKDLKGMQL